jgi:hypothetical protein
MVLDRYKQNKKQSQDNISSSGYYPRNKKQEEIVKMFVNIIYWIESFEKGEKWLDSIREKENYNSNMISYGDFFVNTTSNKFPDYLIITSLEEFNQIKDQYEYELVLSMPIK